MSDQLKPCPFCGSEPLMVHAVLEEYHSVNPEIICRECGYRIKAKNLAIAIAYSPKENCDFMDRQTIAVWNTRPAEDALTAEVERLKAALFSIARFGKGQPFKFRTKAEYVDHFRLIQKFAQDALFNTPDTGKMEEN